MATIEIPAKKWRPEKRLWQSTVSKELDMTPLAITINKEFRLGDIYYHPYWIGRIRTSKYRPFFGEKQHIYYVVCNACSGAYLVLHNIPKSKSEDYDDSKLISVRVSKEQFEDKIMQESIGLHINRQFIYGSPKAECLDSQLLYIPVQEIHARSKKSKGAYSLFFVNVFNGRVEKQR